MNNNSEIISQEKVNEIANTLEIIAEAGKFEVVGSAELVNPFMPQPLSPENQKWADIFNNQEEF